jgi:putative toxin-antitoxin system antitoxin component (TIGR02293 family)
VATIDLALKDASRTKLTQTKSAAAKMKTVRGFGFVEHDVDDVILGQSKIAAKPTGGIYEGTFSPEDLSEVVTRLRSLTPAQRIRTEREGVPGSLVKVIAKTMGVANQRMFEVIGVPKATAEKKAATDAPITGSAGQSAIGMMRLLGLAQEIVANSMSEEAKDFDVGKWLGRWIEIPQPALGGLKPSEVLDTPTGIETVEKLLGALESGVYL